MMALIKILLWILTISSAYAIGAIGLQCLPSIGTSSNYENINAVLLNLSYSYIAGCIFYIFTSYLPHFIKAQKFKPIILNKCSIIRGRIEDSMKCVLPMTQWNNLTITEDILAKTFSSVSIFSPSAYSIAKQNATILEHLKGQRKEIKQLILDILEYKEYLSIDEVAKVESIRESDYFSLLNAFQFPIMDNPRKREQVAHELWKVYQITKEL